MARTPTPLAKRLMSKFTAGPGCWEWTASVDRAGYERLWSMEAGRPVAAHRAVYELLVGPIPEGLQIDHLCRTPRCVNPAHLEPVTQAENIRRGVAGENRRAEAAATTRCKWGHEFTADNTYIDKNANGNPRRVCRQCKNRRQRELTQRRRAVA